MSVFVKYIYGIHTCGVTCLYEGNNRYCSHQGHLRSLYRYSDCEKNILNKKYDLSQVHIPQNQKPMKSVKYLLSTKNILLFIQLL